MLPGRNIISGKASVASVKEAEGAGGRGEEGVLWACQQGIQGTEFPNKFLGSKEDLDCLKNRFEYSLNKECSNYLHTQN